VRGKLTRYGYSASKSAISRHRALNKAVAKYGYAGTVGHLNLIANFTKHSQPKYHRIYRNDMHWLKSTYR